MVVNLCLPHFQTTIQCNKLCADSYDVTNLLSADPDVRRRGFKLEYFLRPPMQVTLQFSLQVEVSRVDVQLWPWAMDRGQACKRLEISTSSSLPPPHPPSNPPPRPRCPQQGPASGLRGGRHRGQEGRRDPWFKGHHWGCEGQDQGHHQTDRDSVQAEFKLVGRCDLRDDPPVCFSHPLSQPRPPFPSPAPPPPAGCRREQLWSSASLGAVRQLRVTVAFGGAASALGLKALAVWGLPARCCPPLEVERLHRAHTASLGPPPAGPGHSAPRTSSTSPPATATPPASLPDVPEEFLDPLTQEVMALPMLLPSGASVDLSTLEEYRRREATWGRAPNDPFTAVPFTPDAGPLPNPHLKSRIDRFLLQPGLGVGGGSGVREGVLGRQEDGGTPHTSRLVAVRGDERGKEGEEEEEIKLHPCNGNASSSLLGALCGDTDTRRQEPPSAGTRAARRENGRADRPDLHAPWPGEARGPDLGLDTKPSLGGDPSPAGPDSEEPSSKRARTDGEAGPGCSSHEQRLCSSLDQALLSALRGRPSFTSSASHTTTTPGEHRPGEHRCAVCSCSLSAYSCTPAYRLPCTHFLCRPCLHRKSRPPSSSVASEMPKHFLCPVCQSPAPSSDITRVHH
ncbi:RING finger protein 37 [Osmerus mordax]|uniref:RING finger protein 37 n=1 Tax=Osmerus mordax TaxID=8014 RepID=UPI0035109A86